MQALHLLIGNTLAARLRAAAERDGRLVNSQVAYILEQALPPLEPVTAAAGAGETERAD